LSDEWLSGWDATEGIVSVWVDRDAEATLWRRSGNPAIRVLEGQRVDRRLCVPALRRVCY